MFACRYSFGVVVFPGSNCDHDAYHVISKHVGQPVDLIWHQDTILAGYDAVLIPGGAIFVTVMAINFVGDGLRDALDPRSRL